MPKNSNYYYDTLLAHSLVQLIPAHEKPSIRAWFKKLHHLKSTDKEIEMRDDYMKFILMMLQCQKVREPFNAPPPEKLEPVRDLVPAKIYEEIIISNDTDTNIKWINDLESSTDNNNDLDRYLVSAPAQFLKNQPQPQDGFVCYLAAFCD